MGKDIVKEAVLTNNVILESVMVNKWAQRIMYTLQLDGAPERSEEICKLLVAAREKLERVVMMMKYDEAN